MHTEYRHPAQYSPPQDYLQDKKKAEKHLKEVLKGSYHKGQLQHMGGIASFAEKLEHMHYGQGCKVKKELQCALKFMYFYFVTGHDIYKYFAEDAFKLAKHMYEDMDDHEDKDSVKNYLDAIKEYMENVRPGEDDEDDDDDDDDESLEHANPTGYNGRASMRRGSGSSTGSRSRGGRSMRHSRWGSRPMPRPRVNQGRSMRWGTNGNSYYNPDDYDMNGDLLHANNNPNGYNGSGNSGRTNANGSRSGNGTVNL